MSTSTNNHTFTTRLLIPKVANPTKKMNAMKGAQVTNRKRKESKLAQELESLTANNFIKKTKKIRFDRRQESAKRVLGNLQEVFNQKRIK